MTQSIGVFVESLVVSATAHCYGIVLEGVDGCWCFDLGGVVNFDIADGGGVLVRYWLEAAVYVELGGSVSKICVMDDRRIESADTPTDYKLYSRRNN